MLNNSIFNGLLFNNLIANYLVSAYRSLSRHKLNLVLTVIGLSIGLAATFLVALYALHESSYDTYQPDAERTYRLVMHQKITGSEFPRTTPRGANTLKNVAGVEDVLTLIHSKWLLHRKVKIGNDYFKLNQVVAGTRNFTDFIDINVLHGDLTTALAEPNKVALSQSEAIRLFGIENAIGKTMLQIQGNNTLTVSAVFADFSENTHFGIKTIFSATPHVNAIGKHAITYVKLLPNADIEAVQLQATEIFNGLWHDTSNEIEFYLQPLLAIHLSENFNVDMKVGGSTKTVVISIALSVLLMLISGFNYINMSIAQAGQRAKEVGVRKVLGASKLQLVFQFLTESVAITAIAAVIAAAMVELLLPSFNQLIGRELLIANWPNLLRDIIIAIIVIGVISGLYPALFISSFSVQRVLSGDFGRGKTAIIIRKLLMIFQSALSVCLIIAAMSLYLQLNFLQNLSVNYAKSQRLSVTGLPQSKLYSSDSQSLYRALAKIEGVNYTTPTDFDLTKNMNAGAFVESIAGIESFDIVMGYGGVGFNAVKSLGLELVAGRDFSEKFQSDWFNEKQGTIGILISESVIADAGYESAQQAIGKVWLFSAGGQQHLKGKIIGVIKDVKIGSARNASAPVLFACGLPVGGVYSIVFEVDDENSLTTKQEIIDILEQRLQLNALTIDRVKDSYQQLYQGDERLVKMVVVFCSLAVFLTCVGMFGLAAFNAQQRSKEVAIRKVLGASRFSLVALLTSESIVLVIMSLLLAFPAAYYLINDWLNNFNDRISQSVMIYLLSALIIAIVSWFTVATIALRTASISPSFSLRND
ncbi:MAG: ABC transporter permease [Colwellia sp.]|nr:ABC transporter permease [Colwellia sp.]